MGLGVEENWMRIGSSAATSLGVASLEIPLKIKNSQNFHQLDSFSFLGREIMKVRL